MYQFHIKKGIPYPLGATIKNHGVNFSMVNDSAEECGVILYDKQNDESQKLRFEDRHKIGNIACFYIEGLDFNRFDYNFYIGSQVIVDKYAKRIIGNELWGAEKSGEVQLKSGLYKSVFDWKKDKTLHVPYKDSILYSLHVRSFTMHVSSKVKHKGTFEGVVEKIPYLKDLGITAIEFMPVYEFREYESGEDKSSIAYQVSHYMDVPDKMADENVRKLNYWGFKEAFYFAPKAAYAATDDPCESFKKMVMELHQNGIEVILQFYFPKSVKQGYILEVIKYWVMEYHIDGVHLMGDQIPVTLLATEPMFSNTKIMSYDFSLEDIYENGKAPRYKNLGYYRKEFSHDTRCFLKGDADMLRGFQYHMKNQNPTCGIVNYITNYNGFTMMDLVSYDRKHNEANLENNTDGTEYNYSWNCGYEGPTRKKSVLALRRKQIRNAFLFLLTAQGTPLILAGDEFGNTQNGNNNCYCQDNEMSWLDWRLLKRNAEQFLFVKNLIEFRKSHPVLHKEDMLTLSDHFGFGYPDLSYHGKEAWRGELENYNRHIAMLYCGKYGKKPEGKDDDFIYLAYNMYWEEISFALPALPKDYKWKCTVYSEDPDVDKVKIEDTDEKIKVAPRSVMVLTGVRQKKRTGRK